MSLLNVWISPTLALVGVDTKSLSLEVSGPIESSKIVHLAHQNVLVAARGSQRFLLEIFAALWIRSSESTLDEIETWLPAEIDAGADKMIEMFRSHGLEDPRIGDIELCIVGWSAKRSRMIGFRYTRSMKAPKFAIDVVDEYSIGPNAGWSATNPPPIPCNIESMISLAKEQVLFGRTNYPTDVIGGRLLVAELTKDILTMRNVGDLG